MAIAFDAGSTGAIVLAGTNISWSHTVTGSNPILYIGFYIQGPTGGGHASSVTYNGITATQVNSVARGSTAEQMYLFELVNPALGTNTISCTSDTSAILLGYAASYTGVLQSSQPDVNNTNTALSGSTGLTTSVTTTVNNDWSVLFAGHGFAETINAGTGSTRRAAASDDANGFGWFDSGGSITPAGSYSMTVSWATAAGAGTNMSSFKPFVGVGSLTLLGVGT